MLKPIIIYTKSGEKFKDSNNVSFKKITVFKENGIKIDLYREDEKVYITFEEIHNITIIGGQTEYVAIDKIFDTPAINFKVVLTELVWRLLFENMTKEYLEDMLTEKKQIGYLLGKKESQKEMKKALGIFD